MKILFIGKRFYTNRDALTEKYGRIYQLPYHWAKAGIDTTLWLIDYHSYDFLEKNDDGLKIISTPVKNGKFFCQYKKEKINSNKPDVIIASGDCYIGFLGYRLAKMLNVKFIFDVYDKYNEFGGYFNVLGFDLYKYLLEKSDVCLFASKTLAEHHQDRVKKHIIVPNGIDDELFKPMNKNEARKQLGLSEEKIYIGYFGTLDVDRGIDDLLAAHSILLSEGNKYELLIGGKSRKGLDLDKPMVNYLGNLPYKSVPVVMAACDLLTLPYRRSPYLDMASSCKIAEYLAMKVPIVATRTPNIEKNFETQFMQLINTLVLPNEPKILSEKIKLQLKKKIIANSSPEHSYKSISSKLIQQMAYY